MQEPGRSGFIRRLGRFMNEDKIWWIAPVVLLLVVMSVFLILVEGSALAPLIYAMF